MGYRQDQFLACVGGGLGNWVCGLWIRLTYLERLVDRGFGGATFLVILCLVFQNKREEFCSLSSPGVLWQPDVIGVVFISPLR